MGVVSGVVKESGTPVAGRIVRAYRRDTGALLGSTSSSDGIVVAGDASFNSVELLILDSPTKDYSSRNRAPYSITPSRYATSSSVKKFSSDTVQCSASASGSWSYSKTGGQFNLSTQNWTIDVWVYALPGSANSICSSRFSGAVGWAWTRGGLRAQINGGWSDTQISHAEPSFGVWHYHALCRSGSDIYAFIDGEIVGVKSGVSTVDDSALGDMYIAASTNGGEGPLDGYLYALRFTQGVSRFTAAFTPPAAPPPLSVDGIDPGPVGTYSIATSHTGEVQVVCLDDAAGTTYNDLILRVTPA